ncbi:MAG: putative cobaltochelatase [Veillonellales bacterium]
MKPINKQQRMIYPFSALIGQETLQLGLLLHAVNPRLGGLLIRGEKGTAKSTAVRALVQLLPDITVVSDCPYHCDPLDFDKACKQCRSRKKQLSIATMPVPLVDLPVSATEDRVVGSIDFEQAIKGGHMAFSPGLLGEANRGIIYIDEVNLLDDHIVDVLLSTAGCGINAVEREGISFSHPAEFILVGTMNPEEGDLRPQLLDRFALCVDVQGIVDRQARVAIMKRREEFELDPAGFCARFAVEQKLLRARIKQAQQILPQVHLPQALYRYIGQLCSEAFAAGLRGDIVLSKAAKTLAAWRDHLEVTRQDIDDMAPLVLAHRLRQPPEENQTPQTEQQPEKQQEQGEPEKQNRKPPSDPQENSKSSDQRETSHQERENSGSGAKPSTEVVFAVGKPFAVTRITYKQDRKARRGSGRRSRTQTDSSMGRYVKSTGRRERNDFAIDATIRAAAPFQISRSSPGVAIAIETADIREKIREKRIGNFILFVVDASGSMGARQRMIETKGAILSLLLDAYQKRDRVGMIAFKEDHAEVILPPTNSVELAQKRLAELPIGGKTPLTAGIGKAYEVVMQHQKRSPHMRPIVVLLSDGRANVALNGGKPLAEAYQTAEMLRDELEAKCLVVDTEKKGLLSFGLAQELARHLGGECYTIDQLRADNLAGLVRGASLS